MPSVTRENVLEIAAGAVATGISSYALKQSSGEKRSAGVNPNMLARFFNLPTTMDKDVPTPIWNYLNEPIPGGSGQSRRDLLIGALGAARSNSPA